MKVLFITRGFPSETDPMAGNYEAVQAKALAAKGIHVSVISVYKKTPWLSLFKYGIIKRTVDSVEVYECTIPYFKRRFIRKITIFLRKLSFKRIFNRYVSENGMPDIVHAHIVSIAYQVLFVKEEFHLPFVITEHWTKTNVPEIPDWLKRHACTYYKANKVICVSQALANSLKNNFNVDSIVINNMVSDIFFQSIKINRNDNKFKFIAIGAFRRNKGFDLLIEAFSKGHFPQNVTLDIVGDGEERSLVESKIKEYGLSEQIKLLGTKTPEEINDLLCHSDCFVLPSRLETFAIVVIEAMAKGLPVIATRSGGPETFLRSEQGILVEKENVEQLAQAMRQIIAHYKDYDSNEIREFCHNHFSQDVIANQIINEYKQLLNKNNN